MEKVIYTIGYAHHTQESFLELLIRNKINCIIDVRTMAYSGFHPQFNKEAIRSYLKQHGIQYIHMSDSFGIIKVDRSLNTKEGYVDFEKLATLPIFLKGICRIENGIQKGYRIAFMCAEKDPIDCHRTTLVARKFYELGYDIFHILHDGTLESHQALEERITNLFSPKDDQIHLFIQEKSKQERIREAYAKCSKQIFIVNAKRVLKEDYDYPHPNPEAER